MDLSLGLEEQKFTRGRSVLALDEVTSEAAFASEAVSSVPAGTNSVTNAPETNVPLNADAAKLLYISLAFGMSLAVNAVGILCQTLLRVHANRPLRRRTRRHRAASGGACSPLCAFVQGDQPEPLVGSVDG